jgi:hypothetical protein
VLISGVCGHDIGKICGSYEAPLWQYPGHQNGEELIVNPARKSCSHAGFDVCEERHRRYGEMRYWTFGWLTVIGLLVCAAAPVRADIPVSLVGQWGEGGDAYGVALAGHYAYVADYTGSLHVVDITDPTMPVSVGGCATAGYAFRVAVSGDYAYVAEFEDGLEIIDVSDPTSPTRVAVFDTGGVAYGVAVGGDYAYVADSYNGLEVIDISNPAFPTRVGGYNTTGYAYDVAVSGNYAYVADSPTACR